MKFDNYQEAIKGIEQKGETIKYITSCAKIDKGVFLTCGHLIDEFYYDKICSVTYNDVNVKLSNIQKEKNYKRVCIAIRSDKNTYVFQNKEKWMSCQLVIKIHEYCPLNKDISSEFCYEQNKILITSQKKINNISPVNGKFYQSSGAGMLTQFPNLKIKFPVVNNNGFTGNIWKLRPTYILEVDGFYVLHNVPSFSGMSGAGLYHKSQNNKLIGIVSMHADTVKTTLTFSDSSTNEGIAKAIKSMRKHGIQVTKLSNHKIRVKVTNCTLVRPVSYQGLLKTQQSFDV